MKRYLVIIFLLTGFGLRAQSYKPVLVSGNTWYVLHYGYDYNYTQVLKVSSDSIVDNIRYKKIISCYDSLQSNWSLVGLMREDKVYKDIIFKPLGKNTSEITFYDFSVDTSYTIILSSVGAGLVSTFNQVKFVDSVKIGKTYHKRIFVDYKTGSCMGPCKGDSMGNHIWIEGIGGTEGLINSSLSPNGKDHTLLLCLYNNDSLIYKADSIKYPNCFYWSHFKRPYYSIATPNTMWTEMYYYPNYEGNATFHSYAVKNTDTTINGKLYHKLYHSTDTTFTEDKLCGGLREENKKVYYYSITPVSFSPDYKYTDIPKDNEVVLYDFSLKAGDTTGIRLTNTSYLILNNIDSILIGNNYRNRFTFAEVIDYTIPYSSWIEGIGNIRGLLFRTGYLPSNGLWSDIICFRQNNEVLYHCNVWCNYDYTKCYYTNANVNTIQIKNNIKITPNPVLEKGYIELPNGIYSILKIYDIQGDILKKYQISGKTSIEVSRDGLPAGLYLITLIGKGNTYNLKVIFE